MVFCAHEYTQVHMTPPCTLAAFKVLNARQTFNNLLQALEFGEESALRFNRILQDNATFAVAVDEDNQRLQERKELIDQQRKQASTS